MGLLSHGDQSREKSPVLTTTRGTYSWQTVHLESTWHRFHVSHILEVNNGFDALLKPVIAAGLTVNGLRSGLTHEHVDMLIFLN